MCSKLLFPVIKANKLTHQVHFVTWLEVCAEVPEGSRVLRARSLYCKPLIASKRQLVRTRH